MVKVDSFSFGAIVIGGKKYGCAILLFPDGSVRKRKSGLEKFGSHTIKKRDIQQLIEATPDVLVIGTGTDAKARLEANAGLHAKESKVELMVLPSSAAIHALNELVGEGKRVAALIHITR